MDKQLKETVEEISKRLPLITIEGYPKRQKLLFGWQVKSLMKLTVLPNGEKVKKSHKYLVDTPGSIRETHLMNLKKILATNPDNWEPCQTYIDKVMAESKLVEQTNHAVTLKMDEQ